MKETGTIFDLLDPEISEGQEGYMDIVKNAPSPKDNSFFSDIADYAKTTLKGAVEGASRLGTMMGPLRNTPKIENGKINFGKTHQEQLEHQTEVLDEFLPTEEGFGQTALRRGLREAPSVMSLPGGANLQAGIRTLIGSGAAEGIKELGGPEWLETAAEITAQLGPSVTKNLLSKGKNKEIIDAGRKLGLNDEQITPLIQSEFKQKWLSKLSPKKGSTQKALSSTRESLGNAYSALQNSPAAKSELPTSVQKTLFDKLTTSLKDMPSEVRNKLTEDAKDLVSGPITGESLINFYKDVNHYLGPKTKQLSQLKGPIREALHSISPELGKDFEMLNKLYTKYYPIAEKLKPDLVSSMISAGEALGVLGSITTGYYPSLLAILGEKSARKLAQQMLINPRLQQITEKIVETSQKNKWGIAKKLTTSLSNQLKDGNPTVSEMLKDLSEEDIEKLFTQEKKVEQ